MDPYVITPTIRKRIIKDWQSSIPSMTIDRYGIRRRVGPLLISVSFEVRSYKTAYVTEFCLHNLCYPQECLFAILSRELGVIERYEHEGGAYVDAARRMKEQALLPLEGPVSLSMIFEAYKNYLETQREINLPSIQDPALIAAWAGDDIKAREYLEWGTSVFETWPEHVQLRRGPVDRWRQEMEHMIAHPEILRKTAEDQAILHKVAHIPEEELLLD